MSCVEAFEASFHALQTFSGHPLRPHFLGDVDGCRARGFRFFLAEARYTYDGAGWLPEVYFGLCVPAACTAGHVEVSLAPIFLSVLFGAQGVNAQFADLRVEAAELTGSPTFRSIAPVALAALLLGTLAAAAARCLPGRSARRERGLVSGRISGVWAHDADRLPSVSAMRAAATSAVVAYHSFFLKRDLRSVASMPIAARRLQHVLLLHNSVFSAMSAWLLYETFRQARSSLGRRPVRWLAWAFVRVWRKARRQAPALFCAYYLYHVWLPSVPQELHAQRSYDARRALCSEWRHFVEPDCWNTFANWGILRDAQLDAALALMLAAWGALGDILGLGVAVAFLAWLCRCLLQDDLRQENLLWSFWYRRLPEAVSAILAAHLLAAVDGARGELRRGPWGMMVRLLVASGLAAATVELDWRASEGVERAQMAGGPKPDASRMARWVCVAGFLPLTVAVMLLLPLNGPRLRRCSEDWFLGPLGDKLSLPVLLLHNVVFQLVEGCVLVGPAWDYPFSWALFLVLFGAVLVASWVLSAAAHALFLGPFADLLFPWASCSEHREASERSTAEAPVAQRCDADVASERFTTEAPVAQR